MSVMRGWSGPVLLVLLLPVLLEASDAAGFEQSSQSRGTSRSLLQFSLFPFSLWPATPAPIAPPAAAPAPLAAGLAPVPLAAAPVPALPLPAPAAAATPLSLSTAAAAPATQVQVKQPAASTSSAVLVVTSPEVTAPVTPLLPSVRATVLGPPPPPPAAVSLSLPPAPPAAVASTLPPPPVAGALPQPPPPTTVSTFPAPPPPLVVPAATATGLPAALLQPPPAVLQQPPPAVLQQPPPPPPGLPPAFQAVALPCNPEAPGGCAWLEAMQSVLTSWGAGTAEAVFLCCKRRLPETFHVGGSVGGVRASAAAITGSYGCLYAGSYVVEVDRFRQPVSAKVLRLTQCSDPTATMFITAGVGGSK